VNMILPELLYQVAVYWPIGAITQTGRRDYTAVTPVEIFCYWNNGTHGVTKTDGKGITAVAKVITNYQVVQGGVLWLSNYTKADPAGLALASKPSTVPTHQMIEQVERVFSVSGDEILYEVCL